MLPIPNGQGAILLGCDINSKYSNEIYQLTWDENNLIWSTMSHKLSNPRGNTVAMWIPEGFTIPTGIYNVLKNLPKIIF